MTIEGVSIWCCSFIFKFAPKFTNSLTAVAKLSVDQCWASYGHMRETQSIT
jgi:hypothetical protein